MVPLDLCPILFCVNANYDTCAANNIVAFASYYLGSDCGVFHGLWFSGWFVGQRYGGFLFCDHCSHFFMNLFFRGLHPMRYKFLIFAINAPESV